MVDISICSWMGETAYLINRVPAFHMGPKNGTIQQKHMHSRVKFGYSKDPNNPTSVIPRISPTIQHHGPRNVKVALSMLIFLWQPLRHRLWLRNWWDFCSSSTHPAPKKNSAGHHKGWTFEDQIDHLREGAPALDQTAMYKPIAARKTYPVPQKWQDEMFPESCFATINVLGTSFSFCEWKFRAHSE